MKNVKKLAAVAIAFSVAFTIAPAQAEVALSAPVSFVSGSGGVLS